ncbi:hypothetical protein A2U01_0064798, partial [Trifolium medium]|nr:hypothetical protein [Trifolium medium]
KVAWICHRRKAPVVLQVLMFVMLAAQGAPAFCAMRGREYICMLGSFVQP